MSFHILHVFRHGCYLGKERGLIVYRDRDVVLGRIPVDDLRAVVIAARGVTISSSFISALTRRDAIILHCDSSFRPCGVSAAAGRIIDPKIAFAQAKYSALHRLLWSRILDAKIANEIDVLAAMGRPAARLERERSSANPSEAHCSQYYWKRFFGVVARQNIGRRHEHPINAKLNYGYAVFYALVHRAVVAHGLSPLFGIHHKARYRAHAFVYDLIEPLRPFLELRLYHSELSGKENCAMSEWAKDVAGLAQATRIVMHHRYRLKLIDAIDFYVGSVAKVFAAGDIKHLRIPRLCESTALLKKWKSP